MLLWWYLFDLDWIAIATGPVVASLLPLSAFAALSYDGTAFAAELAAGVRGVHDRLGRALAILIIAGPATLLVQIAVAIVVGRVADLPALLGLSFGILLVSVGVVSVSSARVVVPVARSGRNPYSAQAGAATVSIFASYAVAFATIVLAIPIGAVAIAALITGAPCARLGGTDDRARTRRCGRAGRGHLRRPRARCLGAGDARAAAADPHVGSPVPARRPAWGNRRRRPCPCIFRRVAGHFSV